MEKSIADKLLIDQKKWSAADAAVGFWCIEINRMKKGIASSKLIYINDES